MKEAFKELLKKAIAVTASKLAHVPEYGVYVHAMEQLVYIQSIVMQDRKPTANEMRIIDIGYMAVKELETSDTEYCDILCNVDYYFKRL